ncbi:hypothetical protein [Kamptonema formosum]|uniref:hypothetical protein n=1 Tax=Kamptonema formosum TaxID=331992 RepID=UPI00034599C1|nr:hypothetical protein [Oscillatoria sp. PCC 10802]
MQFSCQAGSEGAGGIAHWAQGLAKAGGLGAPCGDGGEGVREGRLALPTRKVSQGQGGDEKKINIQTVGAQFYVGFWVN